MKPYAYADPRSLSEAWYDALYGPKQQPRARPASEAAQKPARASGAPAEPAEEFESSLTQARASVRTPARPLLASETATAEDEEPPAAAPRKRLRAVRPAAAAETEIADRSDLEIDDGSGGLKLLVSQRGGDVEIVAICEREARERTADALARARIALGARGIALTTTLREKNAGEAR